MCTQSSSVNGGDKDIPADIFYSLIISLLNSFIYSLKNKEVINIIKKNQEEMILPQRENKDHLLQTTDLKLKILFSKSTHNEKVVK